MEEQPQGGYIITSVRVDRDKFLSTRVRLLTDGVPSFSKFVERCMDDFLAKPRE